MWKKIALIVARIGLSLLAPKVGGVLNEIQKVAEVALPIVESVAKSEMVKNGDDVNQIKWNSSMAMTKDALLDAGIAQKNHIVESGVQLAYSLIKDKIKK